MINSIFCCIFYLKNSKTCGGINNLTISQPIIEAEFPYKKDLPLGLVVISIAGYTVFELSKPEKKGNTLLNSLL